MSVIWMIEPPANQREGGLELAISNSTQALLDTGFTVKRVNLLEQIYDEARANDVFFYHGLWQLKFHWLSKWAKTRGIKQVLAPHGMLEPWAMRHKAYKKCIFFKFFEKKHLSRMNFMIATGPPEKKSILTHLPLSNVVEIPLFLCKYPEPNYKGARNKLGLSAETKVWVYLSRIHVKKGLHLVLEAFSKYCVQNETPQHLFVVGDGQGEYTSNCRSLASSIQAKLKPQHSLTWVGPQWGFEKWTYVQAADVFCLPTQSENFGLAVLEALKMGTPVIVGKETPWIDKKGLITITPNLESFLQSVEIILKNRTVDSEFVDSFTSKVLVDFFYKCVND